ncbi:MAG: hypothetical protein NVS1B3_18050 [Candidatus Dormibacteraceae bacterium]
MTRYIFAILVLMVAALAPGTALAEDNTSLVASGFSSPRGIVFFHGELLVAEAGTGGPYCNNLPPPEFLCIGNTSQISRINIANGHHTPLISGLFSAIENHGGPPEALGSEGLSVSGDRVLNIMGLYPQQIDEIHCAPSDTGCAQMVALARAQAGHLISVDEDGVMRAVASVGGYDYDWTANKLPQEHDANPYGVLSANGGAYVVDSGANTLDFVSKRGRISVFHHFPLRYAGFPSDEVPTCVARTDEALWVGSLSGHLFRVDEEGATQVSVPQLKHVTGCTSDKNGNLYLVNMWTTPGPPGFNALGTGNVVKFNADDGTSSVVASSLNLPNMASIGPDGNLYVTADSICPSTGYPFCPHGGTVWKVRLPSENNQD